MNACTPVHAHLGETGWFGRRDAGWEGTWSRDGSSVMHVLQVGGGAFLLGFELFQVLQDV